MSGFQSAYAVRWDADTILVTRHSSLETTLGGAGRQPHDRIGPHAQLVVLGDVADRDRGMVARRELVSAQVEPVVRGELVVHDHLGLAAGVADAIAHMPRVLQAA